ncbi:MAG: hypothetical protein Q9M40_13890 [Sulfurimonas sp.]|nr:hypothetical protein [Sulfurimonas sp.]
MLEDILIGVDIKYPNLPFAKAFEVEIYPMKLSPKMSEELKEEDKNFYKYIENFLLNKGVLYHIEYNLINEDFKGYIKDIDENYTLQDSTKLRLLLQKATFKGSGELLAPKELSSKVKSFEFDVVKNERSFNILLHKFKSSSNFESLHTYVTSVDVESLLLKLKEIDADVTISMKKLRTNASSNDQDLKTQLNSKTSIKSLEYSSLESKFSMKKFNFDIALNALEKKKYENLMGILSDTNNALSPKSSQKLQKAIVELLSKGVVLEIADFSVKEFSTEVYKNIKGFEMHSTLRVIEDKNLAQKIQISPVLAIGDLSLVSEIRISKELYTKLKENNIMLTRMDGYEKEDGDDYIFALEFVDTQASINGKSIN